jgi:hypothetical protein
MNNKVIVVGFLTLLALGGLIFYTYGPASHPLGPTVNPASLKPMSTQSNTGSSTSAVNTYHNRDLAENFYTIQVPQSWQPGPNQPGGYAFTFSGGTAKVETMDVPDNSTLELYVLSQDEPKLKNSLSGYKRVGYQKVSVGGNDAYQLTYTGTIDGASSQTIRTYITGADKAGVITLSANANRATSIVPIFNSIISSFRWEK